MRQTGEATESKRDGRDWITNENEEKKNMVGWSGRDTVSGT